MILFVKCALDRDVSQRLYHLIIVNDIVYFLLPKKAY